jgi:protein-tyrosine phosphatase
MAETKVLEKIHFCRTTFKQVLVHCHAGMQRSCAIVACYLMKYYKMNVKEAIAYIKEKRAVAFYNGATFITAMNQFHMSLQR